MGNIQKMMKQAKEMQDRLQKEMAEMRVEGSSGGGMVTVVLDGFAHGYSDCPSGRQTPRAFVWFERRRVSYVYGG